MKYEIVVPPMGESIKEATVGAFLKKNGDRVSEDQELLELETDKVNQVVFATHKGVINFVVKQGDKVAIGAHLATIESIDEAVKEEPVLKSGEEKKEVPKKIEEKKESPKVEMVQIERETRKKVSRIRQVIAERLMQAQHGAAMLTTFNEVDLSEVIALREKYKELYLKEYQVKLGFMSFFVKAAVSALQAFPVVNSYLDGDDLVFRNYFNISVAMSTDKGLVVPVLRDVDKATFYQIEQGIESFSQKAKKGELKVEDFQGGGFTITNGGTFGSLLSTPILNPPQVAILGMHKIVKRPVAIDDQVVIRPMMYLALTYDHRVLDGKEAVSFLVHIKQCLEDPARLLLDV